MSSKAIIEERIKKFLKSDSAEVLCISGAWGTGKTHITQKCVGDYLKTNERETYSSYSYVSLFGLNSIGQVYQTTLAETKPQNFIKSNAKTIVQTVTGLLSSISILGKAIPNIDITPYLISSIKEQIICFDDLERHGKNLRLEDIFGLASKLKEEKKCKVILVLNRDALNEDKEEFDRYLEKTADYDLLYEPDFNDIYETATEIFERCNFSAEPIIKETCSELNITNIRVLVKIFNFCADVKSFIDNISDDCKEDVSRDIYRPLVLFAFAKYDSRTAPKGLTLDTLRRCLPRKDVVKINRDEFQKECPEAFNIMHKFHFDPYSVPLPELNEELIEFVDRGYLNELHFQKLIEECTDRRKKGSALNTFDDCVQRFWHSFIFPKDEEEFFKKFEESYREVINQSNSSFLNVIVLAMKKAGRVAEIKELKKIYETEYTAGRIKISPISYESNEVDRGVKNLVKRLKIKTSKSKPTSLKDALNILIKTPENTQALDFAIETGQDDYDKLLVSLSDEEHLESIKAWQNLSSEDPVAKKKLSKIHSKIKRALKTLGEKSDLLKWQVKRFGINL